MITRVTQLTAAILLGLVGLSCAVRTNDELAALMEGGIEDPDGILLWVSTPRDALVGDRMTLTITIENTRKDASFYLEDIDIAGSYLKGFLVVDIQPAPLHRYVDDGDLTLNYQSAIPAGSSQQYNIDLEPENRGVHYGDVDVWGTDEEEQGRFCTARAQTIVE